MIAVHLTALTLLFSAREPVAPFASTDPILALLVWRHEEAVRADAAKRRRRRRAWHRAHLARVAARAVRATVSRGVNAATAGLAQRGIPYVWGGTTPGGFDCSGLVQWAWARVGVYIPRTTWDQAAALPAVPLSALEPGDLVFAEGGGHVGMYVGGGEVLNAPYTGTVVQNTPLADFGGEFARRPG